MAGPRPDAPTNQVRPLSGASEYVANVMLGYDARNLKHTASLVYNVFGERLYVAGRNGAPDGYEQPFNSLDFVYTWYPTDSFTVKLKAQNLLDETVTIERQGIVRRLAPSSASRARGPRSPSGRQRLSGGGAG